MGPGVMRQHGHLARECAAWESYLHIERCWQSPKASTDDSGFRALVRLAQPLLKQWVWARFIEGTSGMDRLREKFTPFARR